MFKIKNYPLYPIFAALLLCFIHVQFLSHTIFFISARLKSIDVLYAWRSKNTRPLAHLQEVVVIGIDDASYQKMNRAWPWGRDVFAVLMEELAKLNPKVVGLDLSFVGESAKPETDRWLAESMSKNKNVIIGDYFDAQGHYIVPLGIFRKAVLGHGFTDTTADRDTVVRRVRTFVKLKGTPEPAYSFSSLIAYAYLGHSTSKCIESHDGNIFFSLPAKHGEAVLQKIGTPVDNRGQHWLSIRYKPQHFTYVPFWKVVTGQVPRGLIEDKIVFVGAVSPVLHDSHLTPLGPMAGIYITAGEALSILDADFLRELFPGKEGMVLMVMAFVSVLVFLRLRYFAKTMIFLCFEALIGGVSIFLFQTKNVIFEPFSPMFVMGVVFATVLFYDSIKGLLESEALKRQAVTDGLTGLYGHRYLSLRLEMEFNRHLASKEEFCFVMIDLDHFKRINDTYGHEKGNEVLVATAKLLKDGVRGSDVVARYGGEEFALILVRAPEKGAFNTLERIRQAVEQNKFLSPTGDFSITISVGICSNKNPDAKSKDELVRLADKALYQAKSKGRNQVCIAPHDAEKK